MPNPTSEVTGVQHREPVKAFEEERVDLPRDVAQKYRDQVNSLRERLKKHIRDNPGFAQLGGWWAARS